MPLSPLPEDNTVRYFLDYVVAGEQHSMQSRAASTMSDATAVGHFQAIAATLQTLVGSNVTFQGVSKCALGSNVRNAVAGLTPVTGTAVVISDPARPFQCVVSGRSSSGRKTKVSIFGAQGIVIPTSWAQQPISTSEIQGFQGLLNSQADFWLAIDATKPTWYNRVTFGYNDHWIKKVRP